MFSFTFHMRTFSRAVLFCSCIHEYVNNQYLIVAFDKINLMLSKIKLKQQPTTAVQTQPHMYSRSSFVFGNVHFVLLLIYGSIPIHIESSVPALFFVFKFIHSVSLQPSFICNVSLMDNIWNCSNEMQIFYCCGFQRTNKTTMNKMW